MGRLILVLVSSSLGEEMGDGRWGSNCFLHSYFLLLPFPGGAILFLPSSFPRRWGQLDLDLALVQWPFSARAERAWIGLVGTPLPRVPDMRFCTAERMRYTGTFAEGCWGTRGSASLPGWKARLDELRFLDASPHLPSPGKGRSKKEERNRSPICHLPSPSSKASGSHAAGDGSEQGVHGDSKSR
jgi:hypothetical protein